MPHYEYHCDACKKDFDLLLTMHEHDEAKIKCPKCGSKNVQQLASAVTVVTSKKS